MIQSTATIDIQVVEPKPMKTKNICMFFKAANSILFRCLNDILTLVVGAIHVGLVAPIVEVWGHIYPVIVFVEEGVIMPHSELGFIIGVLLAFAQIKAQGQLGFPFKTHPCHIRFSVATVVMYSLACAMGLVVSALGVDRASIFAITARVGKIGFLCILVASLAFLLFFDTNN